MSKIWTRLCSFNLTYVCLNLEGNILFIRGTSLRKSKTRETLRGDFLSFSTGSLLRERIKLTRSCKSSKMFWKRREYSLDLRAISWSSQIQRSCRQSLSNNPCPRIGERRPSRHWDTSKSINTSIKMRFWQSASTLRIRFWSSQ